MKKDIARLVRFGLGGQMNDFRMYVSRLIRKYRVSDTSFSRELEYLLRPMTASDRALSQDLTREVRPSMKAPVRHVKQEDDAEKPLLPQRIAKKIEVMLKEHEQAQVLAANGLAPTSTAIFTGPPGVGKTMTAEWIASRLGLPMYKLSIAETIGGHLGESGNNIQAAFAKVRETAGILFLDEIDAIAKTRSDDSDIGEMKRVVTVLLQQLDDKNPESLILAATNNASLIDPAIWRRFELRIDFPMPDESQVIQVLRDDLGKSDNAGVIPDQWIEALGITLKGMPFSEVRVAAMHIRKLCVLEGCSLKDATIGYIRENTEKLTHAQRIDLAVALVNTSEVTQRAASEMTGVSRQTIRRRTNTQD